MFPDKHIILASQSPRRKQLLEGMGLNIEVRCHLNIDESYPENLKNDFVARFISEKKFNAYQPELHENDILITADTIVCIDNEILGKPADRQQAYLMLKKLSGAKHYVFTGITIGNKEKIIIDSDVSEVWFKSLSDKEIYWYIDTFKPFDKAGSYGVQEWIGYVGIEKIHGSFYNVMGLPTQKVYSILEKFS